MDKTLKEKIRLLESKIGHTPILDMGNGIFGKIEAKNPAGSIKDRAALYMIMHALEGGELTADGTIVEATSGNTGIGLAYVARELGIKAIIVMPENMSEQRRDMIARYGAQLVLTDKSLGMAGAVAKAKEIESGGGWLANQFSNLAGVEAHYYTTAPEIFAQVPNAKYIVAGVGSGGTAMGIKRYIADNHVDCEVVAVEPLASPLMSKGYAGAHAIQGIGANFIPSIVDVNRLDRIETVSDEDAINATKQIYRQYGVKCGISSGAAYSVAMRLRGEITGDIVVILPDDGDRYDACLYK